MCAKLKGVSISRRQIGQIKPMLFIKKNLFEKKKTTNDLFNNQR